MAGFEVVVRPVVFPNIRPPAARSLPTAADPTQGFCTIHGSSGKVVDLPYSWNVSTSNSRPQEMKRRVDEVRVYQQEDDGTVNKKNFVDVHVANKIWTVDSGVGEIRDGVFIPKQGSGKVTTPTTYTKQIPEDNIEIRKIDIIKKNPSYYERLVEGG